VVTAQEFLYFLMTTHYLNWLFIVSGIGNKRGSKQDEWEIFADFCFIRKSKIPPGH
jgi:hypothetical protein